MDLIKKTIKFTVYVDVEAEDKDELSNITTAAWQGIREFIGQGGATSKSNWMVDKVKRNLDLNAS